jgi:type I restriction enzyme S subunit
MSFPRYAKYKDSGDVWLGAVPVNWKLVPLKHLATFRGGGTPSKANLQYWDGNVPWASSKDLKRGAIDDTVDHISQMAVDDGAELVEPGTLLIVVRGMILAHTFPVTKALVTMAINQDLKGVTPKKGLDCDFLANLLRAAAPETFRRLDEAGHGTKALRMEAWTAMVLPLPSLDEQTVIVAFLDRETAKIDALVAEQRRLMDLLKEKRQAVISHAVTKGLNPDIAMKDSGVEWLGDVPAHWTVMPVKYVVKLRSGATPSKANLAYWNGNIPWASSKDLKSESLADTGDHITEQALVDGAAELVPAGSLLIVVRGMILAHTFPVTVAAVPMAINQDLKALTPRDRLDSGFLAWVMRGASRESIRLTDEAGHGTKVLRMNTWAAMSLPIPPIIEQRAIVLSVIGSMAEFDALTTEAHRAIDLLQERRTALISAAVTGQIDVRHLATVAEAA